METLFREHIIVKVPSVFKEDSKYKGVDGKKLVIDGSFEPQQHIRTYGIVTSVPEDLMDEPISRNHLSGPGYADKDYEPFDFVTATSIKQDICVGDKAHFHYNCLVPNSHTDNYNHFFMGTKKEMENGKEVRYHYFRIKYSLVFAVVRYHKMVDSMKDFEWWMEPDLVKGTLPTNTAPFKEQEVFVHGDDSYTQEILPIGGYVLVQPDFETWEDISIPTPETLNGRVLLDDKGQPVMKPMEQWIVKKQAPGKWYLAGIVRHVGSPLLVDTCTLSPGDYVYFQRHADTHVTIEGVDYYRMRQRYIVAKDTLKSMEYAQV